MDVDAVRGGQAHGAWLKHLGTTEREMQHLLVTEPLQPSRVRDHARVGREDTGHVGEDFAPLQAERQGQRDGRSVRTAAAERRDVAVGGGALEPGDKHDGTTVERLDDALRRQP